MRRLVFAVGVVALMTASLGAQEPQRESLWQRVKGVFTGKSKKDAPKSDVRPMSGDAKRPTPTAAKETRGVVYVDDGKSAPTAKTTTPSRTALPKPKPAPPTPIPPANTALEDKSSPPTSAAAPSTTTTPATPASRTAAASPSDALVQKLTRQVSQKCPQARNVKVIFTAEKEVTVEMEVRTQAEANSLVEQVFAIRDLDPYRVNVKFVVPQE